MLPLTEQSYRRLLAGTGYNIFNNSNIKAVFMNNGVLSVDRIYGQTSGDGPITYVQSNTASPTKFSFADNITFEMAREDPGNSLPQNDVANKLKVKGKITLGVSDFTADGTTDQFVILIDDQYKEVVSYVKLNADTDNTIMNNISEIAFTDDIMNSNALYTTTELTFSAGFEDFITGQISKDNLRLLILKDKSPGSFSHYTYGAILSCTDIFSLSTVQDGDRIKVLSYGHGLNNLGFQRYYSYNAGFAMTLSASETVINGGGATQGFTPPYNAVLYDQATYKPLAFLDESLGITGQDNVFVKADSNQRDYNLLNMQPGS